MPKISAAQLFDDNREKLQLEWVAGHAGGTRELDNDHLRDSREGLIGHLNFIHANWIQVIGRTELAYLKGLDAESLQRTLQQIKASELACMIVADGEQAPPSLTALADAINIAFFSTPLDSMELMWMLRPYLARALAVSTTMHGVFLDVLGMGVMLTGDSGVGKSELALELISRGSGLIADDVIELYRIAPEMIEGRCPPLLRDFLEVRGLGVLNIRAIFGESVLRPRKSLKLIVHLEKPAGAEASIVERLPLKPGFQVIMGINVTKVTIPVAAGRNLAVLVEAAVRNRVLQLRGIDSTHDFVARQAQQMLDDPS
jgi:HPr kinase/phosphorylase